MDIILFINCLYAGGAERVTCNLANYLVEKGHNVKILTMSETDSSYELSKKVFVNSLLAKADRKSKFYNILIRTIRLCEYLLKHKETDAYVVMLPKTTIMLLAFRWMTKAKIIVSERVDPAIYSPALAKLLKHYAHRADGYVFQTSDAYKWYEKWIKNVKKVVIPNAINKEFLVDMDDLEKENIIISAGRLCKQKNFELLIRAFNKIADKFPDYKLVIYGDGDEKSRLKELIIKLKLEERVLLPGNVIDIVDKYKKARVFALASDYEGMPNVLIEAMALGLPCVATDCPCGGPRFLISNGINGLLVPVNDVDRFSYALDNILSSEEIAMSLGREAIKVRDFLNADKIYSQWEMFINEIVSV